MDREAMLGDIEILFDFLWKVAELLEDPSDRMPEELDLLAEVGRIIRGWREEVEAVE